MYGHLGILVRNGVNKNPLDKYDLNGGICSFQPNPTLAATSDETKNHH